MLKYSPPVNMAGLSIVLRTQTTASQLYGGENFSNRPTPLSISHEGLKAFGENALYVLIDDIFMGRRRSLKFKDIFYFN